MRLLIMRRGLPMLLLLLMAVAVLLILSGASSVGFTFGLVVAGMTGVVLVSTVLYDVIEDANRSRPQKRRLNRSPHVRGY